MFNSDLRYISDFEDLSTRSNQTVSDSDVGNTWVLIARVWALVVSIFGCTGNLVTASTIIQQIYLQERRQKLHSVSDSCFQQLKIIKEGNTSESSETSSSTSLCQRKKNSFRPRPSLTVPSSSRRNSETLRELPVVKDLRNVDYYNSRESSPCSQSIDKFFVTVESPSISPSEAKFLQLKPDHEENSLSNHSAEEDPKQQGISGNSNNVHSLHDISPGFCNTPAKCSLVGHVRGSTCPVEGCDDRIATNSTSSSQIIRGHEKTSARKSLSIRSRSLSLNRYDPSSHPAKHSVMRIQGDTLLILHIIICDFLYCSVSLPHTYYVYGFESNNGTTLPSFCKEAAFIRYVNAFAEWMTLGLLAIQRCIDLAKPPNARFFKMKSTIYFLIGIWVLSTILQVGNLIHGNFGYNAQTRKCDCIGPKESMLYFYTLDSLLPCSLMMIGCLSIILQVVRNKRRLQKFGMSSEMVALREKEMWQSACVVLTLLFLFLMCVIPICIFNVLYTFDVTDNSDLGIILYMVYWLQYGINFLVYATSKRKFRLAYKNLFAGMLNKCRKGCCRNESGNELNNFENES